MLPPSPPLKLHTLTIVTLQHRWGDQKPVAITVYYHLSFERVTRDLSTALHTVPTYAKVDRFAEAHGYSSGHSLSVVELSLSRFLSGEVVDGGVVECHRCRL